MDYPNDDGNPLEDEFLASFGGGGGDYTDFFHSSDSPIHENLQPPLHEEMDDFLSYTDSSLNIPMADYPGPEPPRLSPVPGYQTMSYDHMSMDNSINAQGYNSFEQPVAVINGEYTHPVVDDSPMHREDTPQHGYYANELPSTSTHQQQPTYAPTPPPTRPAPSQPSRHQPPPRQRPIQPKSSSSRKRGNDHSQNGAVAPVQQSVTLNPNESAQVGAMMAELANLRSQQSMPGIDNSRRLEELESQILAIFSKTGAVQVPGLPAAAEPPPPAPSRSHQRQSRPQQNHHPPQRQIQPQRHFEPSPPYQPQMIVVSQPTTSQGNGYQEYHHQVVHQSPVPPQQAQQRPPQQLYRVNTIPQQVQGTVYVQPQQMNQPTVGQFVRQQQQHGQVRQSQVQHHVMIQPAVSLQQPQHIQMQPPHLHQQQQHVAPPVLTPQIRVVRPPPRQTRVQVERECAERREMRKKRVHDFFSDMERQFHQPDTERPFSDLSDVLKRLLPYHQHNERDLKEEHIQFIDLNLMRANLNNNERVKYLQRRTRKIFYEEAARSEIKEEQNLLLALDVEYERRKLEEERAYVNDYTRVNFVMTSPVIPALRGMNVAHPTPAANPPKMVNQYEYTPFVEIARPVSPCKSPYLMSPASSIRSPSPLKYPTFHSPRLRGRSSNSTSSQNEPPFVAAPIPSARRHHVAKKVPKIKVEEEPGQAKSFEAVKKTKEVPKRPELKVKEIKREEPSPSKSPVKVVKPVKIRVKEEVPEVGPSVPNCVETAPRGMPAKKAFLNRVRNAMPPALRSPPAQMAKPTKPAANGRLDSDGSCSPELGMDDFSSVPSTPVEPKKEMTLPSPLKKLVPLPPPLPKKPVVKEKKETAAEIPERKIKFKGLEPPPKDVIRRKSAVVKDESTPQRLLKREDQENMADVDTPLTDASAVKRPPIKLKFKLGDSVFLVQGVEKDGNENVLKEKEKEAKRLRKLKKEKKRQKREKHAKKREERLLQAGSSSPKEEAVMIQTEGLKFKIKLGGGGRSRTATPTLPVASAVAGPSTSSALNGTVESDVPPPRKIPKLKISFRKPPTAEPKVEVAAMAPVSLPTVAAVASAVRNNGPPLLPPVLLRQPPVAAGSAEGALPLVNFSDQSDSDGERMRTATDETLKSWGMGLTLKQPLPTPPLLPFHP